MSRPLNVQNNEGKFLLGSELGIIRLLREGSLLEFQKLLEAGLHPDSIFTHPSYKNLSLIEFVVNTKDLNLERKTALIEILLEKSATVTHSVVSFAMRNLSILHLEVIAILLFSLPASEWKQMLDICASSLVKEKLSCIFSLKNLFSLLKGKKFSLFRAALKVCCLRKQDIFSFDPFDVNNYVSGKPYTLLHFSTYHLSLASSRREESKCELEKVVSLLLRLGADPSKVTEESSLNRKVFSSLSLLAIGFSEEPLGEIIPSKVHEALLERCIQKVLEKHPLDNAEKTLTSKKIAEKVAKRAAPCLLSRTSGPKIKKLKIEYS